MLNGVHKADRVNFQSSKAAGAEKAAKFIYESALNSTSNVSRKEGQGIKRWVNHIFSKGSGGKLVPKTAIEEGERAILNNVIRLLEVKGKSGRQFKRATIIGRLMKKRIKEIDAMQAERVRQSAIKTLRDFPYAVRPLNLMA